MIKTFTNKINVFSMAALSVLVKASTHCERAQAGRVRLVIAILTRTFSCLFCTSQHGCHFVPHPLVLLMGVITT